MSNTIPLNARSLSFKSRGIHCVLEFDGEHLTCCAKGGVELKFSKLELWRITPEFLVDRSISHESRKLARTSRNSGLAAVVVYFSEIHSHVPLLVPVLAVTAAWHLLLFFRTAFPLQKTRLLSDFGDEIAVIPHHEDNLQQRQRFEAGLLEAIQQARQKREGDG